MAVKRVYKKKFKNVIVKSGFVYSFKYLAFSNDPNPVCIILYALEGISHTGHQFRFFQGINFTYIPRNIRKQFAKEWKEVMKKSNGNVKFTWEKVKRRYPQLKVAIRRYFFKPSYYITKLVEIPLDDIEKVVISTWSKDFSKKIELV